MAACNGNDVQIAFFLSFSSRARTPLHCLHKTRVLPRSHYGCGFFFSRALGITVKLEKSPRTAIIPALWFPCAHHVKLCAPRIIRAHYVIAVNIHIAIFYTRLAPVTRAIRVVAHSYAQAARYDIIGFIVFRRSNAPRLPSASSGNTFPFVRAAAKDKVKVFRFCALNSP